MAVCSLTDVLPVDVGLAMCALGPAGLGLVASVLFLIATWGFPRARGRSWARRVAIGCAALAVLCVSYVWLSSRAASDRRQRRYLERERARERSEASQRAVTPPTGPSDASAAPAP